MFKSIFTKYTATFMAIIILSFSLLTSVVSSITAEYYTSVSNDRLKSASRSISNLLSEVIDEKDGKNAIGNFLKSSGFQVSSTFTALTRASGDDYSLVITDSDYNVLFRIGDVPHEYVELNADGAPVRLSQNTVSRIGSGVYTPKKRAPGLLRIGSSACGTAIKSGVDTIGSVVVFTTADSVNNMISKTVKAIIMTSLWMALAALVAVYFITERVSSPLREMSKAAKRFAKGKFDERITVRGNDEIASLATAMNNMASDLESLERSRRDFLSNVSHDLRTPMTTISGFIDALIEGAVPKEKEGEYLALISGEIKRLSRLVSNLLDISRLESGDRKFTFTAFDICEMGRLILISFEQKLEEKRLEVDFDTESDTIYAYADRDAVYQIFYNICDNAVKFSRNGARYEIKIDLSGSKIRVSVFNEGQGVSPEDLPHIFDRFYKGDKSRGLDKTGTGLGMYIAKSIIEAHGEEIKCESDYGENCRFTFTLSQAPDSAIKKAAEEDGDGNDK